MYSLTHFSCRAPSCLNVGHMFMVRERKGKASGNALRERVPTYHEVLPWGMEG